MKNSTNASALRVRALQKTRQRQSVSREKKQKKVKDSLKKKSMGISLREEVMSKEVYDAALEGDDEIFKKTESDLLRKTFVLNNIVHVAFRSIIYDAMFARKAVSRFPHLLWERNLDGDTPLHLAAGLRGNEELVKEVCNKLTEDFVREVCENIPIDVVSPLRMKNAMGNTPLHVALIRNQPKVAEIMLEKDPSLATIVNNSMEAPLHLAIKYFPDFFVEDNVDPFDPDLVKQRNFMEQKKLEFIEMMREKEPSWNYPAEEEYEIERYNGSAEYKEIKMIMVLLEQASYVAGWQDASGLTPLHLAASLDKAYNIVVISYIIHCCPPSMEVCDSSGKTILHHLIHRILYLSDAEDCIYKPRLYLLKDHQDHDGNTPLHLAIINTDFIMIQLILSKLSARPNYFLKNKAGQSAYTLFEQGEWPKYFREGSMKGLMMTAKMCHRAKCGDVIMLIRLLLKNGSQYFLAQDSDGKNLIHKIFQIKQGHIVIPDKYNKFIKTLVGMSPRILSDIDKNGDTPLHILAQLNPNNIMIHLATGRVQRSRNYLENPYPGPKPDDPIFFSSSYRAYTYVWESLGRTTFLTELIEHCHLKNPSFFYQGCSMKNVKGNTPLQEAILAENLMLFTKLAELNTEATTLVNNRNETALHLLATVDPTPPIIGDDVLRDIVNNHTKDDRDLFDKDGLTPLMRAINAGNIVFAEKMCSLCPKIAELRGGNGETFWHLLAILPLITFDFEHSSFFTNEVVRNQLKTKDKNEDTALHVAIDRLNFDAAKLFLSFRTYDGTQNFHEHLLGIPSKDGKTPSELIGALPYLPQDFEDFIWEDSTMIGSRSMWRIPTTRTENYVNTMGVIAALLTTITFTAAFTVPGGLDQEKGTPVLISDPAFQVFMISNVLAMCLSMMVLFCLLWIMATGNNSKSVVLLDFSIMFLLAAFYLTLLTFMTGLYATTHLVKRWLAILSLALCSLFLLLMLLYLVGYLLIPSRKAILMYAKAAFWYVNGLCKSSISLIQKCCPWSSSTRPEAQSSMPSNRNDIETSTSVHIEHP